MPLTLLYLIINDYVVHPSTAVTLSHSTVVVCFSCLTSASVSDNSTAADPAHCVYCTFCVYYPLYSCGMLLGMFQLFNLCVCDRQQLYSSRCRSLCLLHIPCLLLHSFRLLDIAKLFNILKSELFVCLKLLRLDRFVFEKFHWDWLCHFLCQLEMLFTCLVRSTHMTIQNDQYIIPQTLVWPCYVILGI